jgi:arsenate reductase-like glutaredoxin family protein
MVEEFKYVYLHHPTCSKAQKCLALLNDKIPQQFQLIDYTKEPLTEDKLRELLNMMDQSDLDNAIRDGTFVSKEHTLSVLLADPLRMQRPILVNQHLKKAVIARPIDRMDIILQ